MEVWLSHRNTAEGERPSPDFQSFFKPCWLVYIWVVDGWSHYSNFLALIRPFGCQCKLLQLYHNRGPLLEMISLFIFHKYWLAGFTWQRLGIVMAEMEAQRIWGFITP